MKGQHIMDGLFVHGGRPKSKKQVKDLLASEDFDEYSIVIENTSMFPGGFDGSLAEARRTDQNGPFYFVGPDPYSNRRFYGTLEYNRQKGRWSCK